VDERIGGCAIVSILSKAFIAVSVLGTILAFYHSYLEHAFTTNFSAVTFAPYASFYGVPYWVFGVVWFPLVLVVGAWSTKLGRAGLRRELLMLLTLGNIVTVYFWYLDILVVKALTLVYISLYLSNYVLTALVVLEHRGSDIMQGYAYGTLTGAVVGLLFGPYGVAVCGIGGGAFGAIRNYVMPKGSAAAAQPPKT
jgi:uncharacterized membrane protein